MSLRRAALARLDAMHSNMNAATARLSLGAKTPTEFVRWLLTRWSTAFSLSLPHPSIIPPAPSDPSPPPPIIAGSLERCCPLPSSPYSFFQRSVGASKLPHLGMNRPLLPASCSCVAIAPSLRTSYIAAPSSPHLPIPRLKLTHGISRSLRGIPLPLLPLESPADGVEKASRCANMIERDRPSAHHRPLRTSCEAHFLPAVPVAPPPSSTSLDLQQSSDSSTHRLFDSVSKRASASLRSDDTIAVEQMPLAPPRHPP